MSAAVTTAATKGRQWIPQRLFSIGQFFWPWLEKQTSEQRKNLEDRLKRDEARIEALRFRNDGDAALEEARRLADSETERRRGTDQKAATYLPLVAALIPLVLTLVSSLWEKKAGSAPIWLNMVLLGLAVAYSASAGHWAFRELKVGVSHEPGLTDLERAWGAPHPSQTLARRLLLHTRRNRDGINWKVTCIKMAHEYLLRAFLTFSLLLLVNICWYLTGLLFQARWPASGPMLTKPEQTIAAVAEVDRLTKEFKHDAAWVVLDQDCRRRTAGKAALVFSLESATSIANIPTALQPDSTDTGTVRTILLSCAGKDIGVMRVWSLPTRLAKLKRSAKLLDPLTAPVTDTVVALKTFWLPINPKADPATLPPMLLQQANLRRDGKGRPLALAITAVGPGVVTFP